VRETSQEINLLILDVVMPTLNGKETYERIQKTTPSVKALFMSGQTGDVVLDKGIEDTAGTTSPSLYQPRSCSGGCGRRWIGEA
jgi:CheY-like chemotaxis protein